MTMLLTQIETKYKEIVRLTQEGVSLRETAQSVGLPETTVSIVLSNLLTQRAILLKLAAQG